MNSIRTVDHHSAPIATRIHAIQQAAYAQEAALIGARRFPPLEQTVEHVRAAQAVFFGAFQSDELVGALALEPAEPGDTITIASLVVHPDQQSQGIGARLLATVVETHGMLRIEVSTAVRNEPALRLYARFGFAECQRRKVGPDRLELVTLERIAELR